MMRAVRAEGRPLPEAPRDLLCVAYSCPPLLDPQAILLAKMLAPLRGLGYRSHVIGLEPRTTLTRTDASLADMLPDDARIVRVPACERRLWFRALNRVLPALLRVPDKHLPVHRRAVRAGLALHRRSRAALLFSWAQYHSCSLVAYRLKRLLGLPWVAHFSDPWRVNPYQPGGAGTRGINALLERRVIAAADAVVFVNQETREATMSRYPREWLDRTHVIPHCFAARLYPETPERQAGIVFRHVGHFYGQRSPHHLLHALKRLLGESPALLEHVHFDFIGKPRPEIAAQVAGLGLERLVRLREGLGYADSLRAMAEADVLLVIEAPAADNLFLPSKLIDYLGAGSPILALSPLNGPAGRLLRGERDRVVAPDDTEAIAAALRAYVTEIRADPGRGRRRAGAEVARFECEVTVRALAALFDRVLERRAPAGAA